MDKTIRFHIGGMSCVNCQNRIEEALNRTDGVISVRVSYRNAVADIVYNDEKITPKEMISAIEALEYKVLPKEKSAGPDMTTTVSILVIIVSLYVMLQRLGLLTLLVPSQLADSGMGYGMLFVIGLVTSVHCVAMCGGINLSQCIQVGSTDRLAVFRPSLAYNLGRVFSYTAMGFVLGLAGFLIGGGNGVGLSVFLQGLLKIVAGLFMMVMGINLLGIFPWLREFTVTVPGFLARRVNQKRAEATRPFLVGMLNGLMPCGPLQSMWIVALASGGPLSGALSMLLFSLGTVPLMLGLGSIVSVLGRRFTHQMMTVGGVLVVVLGLAMLSQGGSLSGWLPPDLLLVLVIALCIAGVLLSIPVEKRFFRNTAKAASLAIVIGAYLLWSYQGALPQNKSTTDSRVKIIDGVQVVNSTLQSGHYPDLTVQAGLPVKWVIDAPEGSVNGCNFRLFIQDYGVDHTFHIGENIIEFTPAEIGTVRYSCWMGMIRGSIFVTGETGAF